MNHQPIKFTLRKAIASDLDFIWRLRLITMQETIAKSYGWDEQIQQNYAAESLKGEIILVEGNKAGVITISDWGDQLHLTFIALLPQYQHRGLGSKLIGYAQNKAKESSKPLTLQVLESNAARLFYEKHGFRVYARNGTEKLLMRWQHNT